MAGAISIKRVFEEIKKIEENMVTKKELESLIETVEIMGNPETMKQIRESTEDIKAGRTEEIDSVNDLFA